MMCWHNQFFLAKFASAHTVDVYRPFQRVFENQEPVQPVGCVSSYVHQFADSQFDQTVLSSYLK